MFGISIKTSFATLLTSLALAFPATAATVFSSVDNGTISRGVSSIGLSSGTNYNHDANSQSRVISNISGFSGVSSLVAGYFVFDLSGYSGTATQATLDVDLAGVNQAFSSTFDLKFYTVTTDPSAFDVSFYESNNSFARAGGATPLGAGRDLFGDITSDLLAGEGSLAVTPGVTGAGPLSITLTTGGLAALNGSVGDLFVLGFSGSGIGGATVNSEVLSIEGLQPVPVPLSGFLLLSAMGGLVMVRRRSNQSQA